MRRNLLLLTLAFAVALPVCAQDVKMPVNLDKLAARASESVDVTLDASMLQLASGFLSKSDPDEVQVKKLISRLKGIYVRSFEFDKEGQYSMSDVEAIRSQLRATRMVKDCRGEIYQRRELGSISEEGRRSGGRAGGYRCRAERTDHSSHRRSDQSRRA